MVGENIMVDVKKAEIIEALQTDILRLEGFKPSNNAAIDLGLGTLKHAFPNASFPLGAVHEFLSFGKENAAATCGFLAGLLSPLMRSVGTTLWISASRTLFPPALQCFGIQPDRIIFIDLKKEKDVMWATEEALKCGALTAVVGEMQDISFTASRRLQLAVEQSQVTGFIIRSNFRNVSTTACVSRWKISPLMSIPIASVPIAIGSFGDGTIEDDLPGIGFPQWRVELLRIRNGRPGVWNLMWMDGRFQTVDKSQNISQENLYYTSSHNPSFASAGRLKKAG